MSPVSISVYILFLWYVVSIGEKKIPPPQSEDGQQ